MYFSLLKPDRYYDSLYHRLIIANHRYIGLGIYVVWIWKLWDMQKKMFGVIYNYWIPSEAKYSVVYC